MRQTISRPLTTLSLCLTVLLAAFGCTEPNSTSTIDGNLPLELSSVEQELGRACVDAVPDKVERCEDLKTSRDRCITAVAINREACEHGQAAERPEQLIDARRNEATPERQRPAGEADRERADGDQRPARPAGDDVADGPRCPDLSGYCRAACAGEELPETPAGCPVPSCLCPESLRYSHAATAAPRWDRMSSTTASTVVVIETAAVKLPIALFRAVLKTVACLTTSRTMLKKPPPVTDDVQWLPGVYNDNV
jgi:hypothetical protein